MKKTLKNILLWITSAFMFLCVIVGVALTPKTEKASAAETVTWQTGVFEMDDGASLKLGNVGGLRFIARMDKTVYDFVMANDDAEFGFIIAPKNLMLAANGDYLNMALSIGGAADKDKIYADGDYYLANGCITNVKYDNLTRSFAAVAYIKYDEEVRYTEYNDLARNNLYDTVNAAALSGKYPELFTERAGGYAQGGEDEGWYGSELFPIVVETDAEYDKLVEIVNETASVDFSGYYVSVKNDAATNKVFTEPAPTIIDAAVYELNKLIAALPETVTMPDAIGQVGRIRDAEKKYNALSDTKKAQVENYAKVESLLTAIKGYDRVYYNDADDGTVIPSYVPNYTSTVGGSATTRTDDVYGNVLTVTSAADGKAALHFQNFPSIEKYAKIYFYARILDVSCDIYLSDGIANDGQGDNNKNTWSVDGYWCNANTWRLVEIDPADGYIGTDFALGFRTETKGFTFEISDFYGIVKAPAEVGLQFGNFTDSGTTNEYGTVYNFTQGWSSTTDLGAFNVGALSGALKAGHDSLRFYIYNPNESDVGFYVSENETWIQTDLATLTAKAWTEVVISPELIEANKTYLLYMCVRSGASTSGWQISPMYSFISEDAYTDHADVKEAIALINAIPDTVTLSDKAAVEAARAAYDKLTSAQQGLVSNISTLTAAETTIADLENANEVIALIDAIDANNPDEAEVAAARAAYDELSAAAKALVTNLAKLEAYEETISNDKALQAAVDNVNALIGSLPNSVTMPDHLVFVARIEEAETAYNALSETGKGMVTNYAKLRTLVSAIQGYDAIYTQTVDGVEVVPSHVPNYTSTIGGTASLGCDSYYGNYLKVTPDAGGKVAIQFKNFPDVSQYTKLYFNIRVVGASCDIYLSDGISNGGWGDDWHNTWSMSGFWANDGNWIQKEVEVSTGIFSSNWALGLRTDTTDVSFEIADIVGVKPETGEATTIYFGNIADSGTTNVYGTVYDLTQGWSGNDTDLGAFNVEILRSALNEGHDSLRFYIYNPNESDVVFYVNENETWIQTELATLTAGAWTEVVLTPAIISSNDTYLTYMCVKSGASTSGWQISPIYSFSSGDVVDKVQARIDVLNTDEPNEYQVQLAREAYEALSEPEKALVTIDNLITCETTLYGDVTDAPFIVDSASDYKIYYESDLKAAATFMQTRLTEATGVELPLVNVEPSTITKYRYAIVLGHKDLMVGNLGLSELDDLVTGRADYVIKKVGRVVVIYANSADGYRMGTLEFLSQTVGYDMLAEDCVIYDASKAATLPEFDVTGEPFDYRQKQTYMTETELEGMGIQSNTELWVHSPEGWDMHNTLHYLPTATYQSAHPAWYYTYTDSGNTSRTQICPTAGGSSTEFNAMVEAIAANMMVQINAQPEKENISFSIMDTADGDDCTCERCKLYDTLYGEGGFAAAWVDLMNAVNAKIRETLPADRVLNIAFLAYRGTEKAPANIDANGYATLMKRYEINDDGSYTQTSEDLKCDEGVTVWLAPINGYFAENFNHADNAETLATIKKWCAISNSVYLWMYGANFKFYMYPYNTWQASAENYKILKDLGVKAAWSQSNETEATAFTDLKAYIDSKFMANVNADYETVLNTYFTNYFGAAATKMREMFDTIVAKCEAIEETYDGLGRGIYDEIESYQEGWLIKTTNYYWTQDEANALIALCDEAKAAIDADTTLTDAQKTAFKNRITKESLFPRYVLCTAYASKYSSSDKTTMRTSFKTDAEALGLTLYKEADGLLSDLYSDWGI